MTLVLPKRPEVVFGVFNRSGLAPEPGENCYANTRFTVGWRIAPKYVGISGPFISKADAQQYLPSALTHWRLAVLRTKRVAISMEAVLVDRIIQRVEAGSWGPRFYFVDGSYVQLSRTRGWQTPIMDGPTEGPMRIRRILATKRTFRLDDGRSLQFDCKLELDRGSIPEWILNQVFPD